MRCYRSKACASIARSPSSHPRCRLSEIITTRVHWHFTYCVSFDILRGRTCGCVFEIKQRFIQFWMLLTTRDLHKLMLHSVSLTTALQPSRCMPSPYTLHTHWHTAVWSFYDYDRRRNIARVIFFSVRPHRMRITAAKDSPRVCVNECRQKSDFFLKFITFGAALLWFYGRIRVHCCCARSPEQPRHTSLRIALNMRTSNHPESHICADADERKTHKLSLSAHCRVEPYGTHAPHTHEHSLVIRLVVVEFALTQSGYLQLIFSSVFFSLLTNSVRTCWDTSDFDADLFDILVFGWAAKIDSYD